jgi:hypothetical protein
MRRGKYGVLSFKKFIKVTDSKVNGVPDIVKIRRNGGVLTMWSITNSTSG